MKGILGVCEKKERRNEKRTRGTNANLKTIMLTHLKKNQQIIPFLLSLFSSAIIQKYHSALPEHVQRVVLASQQTCSLRFYAARG